jgi:hypothetical protein
VPLVCFHLRTETEPVSETSCVVLLPFVYSGCFMFVVVTSVLCVILLSLPFVNKQSRIEDEGWSTSLVFGLGGGIRSPHHKKPPY